MAARQAVTHHEAHRIAHHLISASLVVEETLPLLRRAWQLLDDHQLSLWDACIVTAAAAAGCEMLYSEDLGNGRVIGDVRIHNPFAA